MEFVTETLGVFVWTGVGPGRGLWIGGVGGRGRSREAFVAEQRVYLRLVFRPVQPLRERAAEELFEVHGTVSCD